MKTVDRWNSLVFIMNHSKSEQEKERAKMLLGQLNTAGAMHWMRDEIDTFLSYATIKQTK